MAPKSTRTQPPAPAGPDDLLDNAPISTAPPRIIPNDDDDDEGAPPDDLAAGAGPDEAGDEPSKPVVSSALPFIPAKDVGESVVTDRKPDALRIERDFVLYFHSDPVKFVVGDPDITDPGIMGRAVAERKPVSPVYFEA